jgi:hypothetical protein
VPPAPGFLAVLPCFFDVWQVVPDFWRCSIYYKQPLAREIEKKKPVVRPAQRKNQDQTLNI